MTPRIEDYAIIGDTQTAALVGKNGSIDWACFPRFDSGACFAALLGDERNGRWLLAPAEPIRSIRRRYWPGTLILETEFTTDSGVVAVIDFMPVRGEAPDLIRIAVGVSGRVRMQMHLRAQFDYGSIVPWSEPANDALRLIAGPDALVLRSGLTRRGAPPRTETEFMLLEGERVPFVLTWHPSYNPVEGEHRPEHALKATNRWWQEWSARCRCQGPWKEAVQRSLITLHALTYSPTGGLVAAATTSLPERIGGERNWDYRFCWLRDATFTLYALMLAGYLEEAQSWRDWLLRSAGGEASQLQIMYGVAGERRIHEVHADWLYGYENSRPVRLGNAAERQRQLDVYGEILDSLHQARRLGLPTEPAVWNLERGLVQHLESIWSLPDRGLWEMRGHAKEFTHSKVMAWVAFDRAIRTVEQFGAQGDLERWKAMRSRIHSEICEKGFSRKRNAFVQSYGSDKLDAATLLFPIVGFLPAHDERIRGTVQAIERELSVDGWVYRYRSDPDLEQLPEGGGAFLACSFWLADNYLLAGRNDEARQLFEKVLTAANDVGLLSEEYDPKAGRLLGNFPQAFSHVAVVNTAHNLERASGLSAHRR